jgi:hypothetical protein
MMRFVYRLAWLVILALSTLAFAGPGTGLGGGL